MGKREEQRRERRARVLAAGRELFDQRQFDEVTTAELVAASGLSTGTFFRYATSKSELLIAIYSNRLAEGIEAARASDVSLGAHRRLMTLFEPMIAACETNPGNIMAFQREVLYGTGSGPHREHAIELIHSIETEIRTILTESGKDVHLAHSIYATAYMGIVRMGVGNIAPEELRADVSKRLLRLI